ncbi:HDIG domain-containing protein [Gracilibacillus orientalis]|uniref:HDIG domain-containing protein n=1 Tax=Gracilibacillus orientalis TaxID=334253 RepID=A0A1I4H0X3_9BACI|nr:HD-GYP domain-containing protein [Gracilibacillus orientalis]SFL35313.1 HDIG domain-containing protein [Gracilibacillus orientalis]
MKNTYRYSNLLNEEKRTTVWFLWLVYVIYFAYEIIYYVLIPAIPWEAEPGLDKDGLSYIKYFVIFGLLPISYYYLKKRNPSPVKYIFFIVLTFSDLILDTFTYYGTNQTYATGNIIELVIIMFSPIFVNKRFFYLVLLGTAFKYLILGIILTDSVVAIPLFLVIIFSIVAWILLYRFIGYVNAIQRSYDKQMEGIVKGVITTLELKDPYTRGHSERVAEYALTLAKATGEFADEELKTFYYSCLLHDIGKVNIPDSILTKPDKLTDQEFEIIKTHPTVGAQAIKEVEGMAENINVIKHHHERWDGKGYPDGLTGNQIDYLARVVSIADAFDAMTSSRSYRAALPIEMAYQNLLNGSGTQFDPELITIFQEVYPNWVEYHNNYHELLNKYY